MKLSKSIVPATFAAILTAGLAIISTSAMAVPHESVIGRVDFSDRVGITRPSDVKYDNGRVDPYALGLTKGIYIHTGRPVMNGRQG